MVFEYFSKSTFSASNSQFRVMLITFPALCTQQDARAITERKERTVKNICGMCN